MRIAERMILTGDEPDAGDAGWDCRKIQTDEEPLENLEESVGITT